MMNDTIESNSVYLRSTDKKGGVSITHHRAWNTEAFLDSVSKAAVKEGGNVVVITEHQYREAVWPKK